MTANRPRKSFIAPISQLQSKKTHTFLIPVLSLILWFVMSCNTTLAGQGFSRTFAEDVTPEEKWDNSRSFHRKCCGVSTKTYDDSKLRGENKWLGASPEDWVVYEYQTMKRSEAQARWAQKQAAIREAIEKCKFSYDEIHHKWKYLYRDVEEWQHNLSSEGYDYEKVRQLERLQKQEGADIARKRQDDLEKEREIAAERERKSQREKEEKQRLAHELDIELSVKGMSLAVFCDLFPERARYYGVTKYHDIR